MIVAVYQAYILGFFGFNVYKISTVFLLNQTLQTLLCTNTGDGKNDSENDMEETQQGAEETTSSSASYINCGVQCCLQFADKKCNAATQTEDINPKCFVEQGVQVEELASEDVANVEMDHPYSAEAFTLSPVKNLSSVAASPNISFSNNDHESSPLKAPEDIDDVDYVISSEEYDSATDNDEFPTETNNKTYVQEPKYLIFGSCLNGLLKFSPGCGHVVIETKFKHIGSLLSVKTTCLEGHEFVWYSQPIIKSTPVGNLLISSSILFTGNTFKAFQNFASCLGLKIVSEKTFHNTQELYLFPVISEKWGVEKNAIVHELKKREKISLSGDGRCDSPGHNAKYGTYTFMDNETHKIVDFTVIQVSEVSSSNAMEKSGFERSLKNLEQCGVKIDCITTDRHLSISSFMNKQSSIKHQYDVWHFSKSIVKKLHNKSREKKYEGIGPWIQSISNHLWWSAATCNGDPNLLTEKWVSLCNHITNKHSWQTGTVFHECSHPPLTSRQIKRTCWLKPGSAEYVALEEIVLHPKLLKDIVKLCDFCHTGGLEVYHSMLLKYCPKREHFSYKGMKARSQLAAIDNNENVGRKQAVVERGANTGESKYRKCYSKKQKKWVVKPILEKKTYHFLPEMLERVLEKCESGTAVPLELEVQLPENIAKEPAPDKCELVRRHRSRFDR